MPYSTLNISNIGSPPDDPTCPLPAILYIPDPSFPQPWPCIIGCQAGRFQESGNKPATMLAEFAQEGFMGLLARCRLMNNPIPGQTTDGKWHQQTDDIKIAVRYMRSNPGSLGYSVNGFVGILGGSASAHHAMYAALDGTTGDDKADAAICMSPVTDFGNREADVHNDTINTVVAYGRTTDLATLTARSPIALTLASANPILHYNGDNESMPLSMFTRFRSAMGAQSNYLSIMNTGAAGILHSFDMWTSIHNQAVPWMIEQYEEWAEVDPPEEPASFSFMRTFRVVIVDGQGSTTQNIRAASNYGMEEAIRIAISNRPYTNAGIISVTATIV